MDKFENYLSSLGVNYKDEDIKANEDKAKHNDNKKENKYENSVNNFNKKHDKLLEEGFDLLVNNNINVNKKKEKTDDDIIIMDKLEKNLKDNYGVKAASCIEAKITVDHLRQRVKDKEGIESEKKIQINRTNISSIIGNKFSTSSQPKRISTIDPKNSLNDSKLSRENKENKEKEVDLNNFNNMKNNNNRNNKNCFISNVRTLKFKENYIKNPTTNQIKSNEFLSQYELENFKKPLSTFDHKDNKDKKEERKSVASINNISNDTLNKTNRNSIRSISNASSKGKIVNQKINYSKIESKIKHLFTSANELNNNEVNKDSVLYKLNNVKTDVNISITDEMMKKEEMLRNKTKELHDRKKYTIKKVDDNDKKINIDDNNNTEENNKSTKENNTNTDINDKIKNSNNKGDMNEEASEKNNNINKKESNNNNINKPNRKKDKQNYVKINLKRGYREHQRFKVPTTRKAKFNKYKKLDKLEKELEKNEDQVYFGKGVTGVEDLETLIKDDEEAKYIYNISSENKQIMPYFSEGYLNTMLENDEIAETVVNENEINNISTTDKKCNNNIDSNVINNKLYSPTPIKINNNKNNKLLTQRLSTILRTNTNINNKREAFGTVIRDQQKEFRSLINNSNIFSNNKSGLRFNKNNALNAVSVFDRLSNNNVSSNLNKHFLSFDKNQSLNNSSYKINSNNGNPINNNNSLNFSNKKSFSNVKSNIKLGLSNNKNDTKVNSFTIIEEKETPVKEPKEVKEVNNNNNNIKNNNINTPSKGVNDAYKSSLEYTISKSVNKSERKIQYIDPELEEDLLSDTEVELLEDEILRKVLQDNFNYNSFKKGQLKTIKNLLNNKSTLTITKANSGKSLCYQLPSLVQDGITIYISSHPILIYKQLLSLPKCLSGTCLTPYTTNVQREEILEALALRKIKILFLTPERFCVEFFLSDIFREISLLIIDDSAFACVENSASCFSYYKSCFYSVVDIINRFLKDKSVPILLFSCCIDFKSLGYIKKMFAIEDENVVDCFNKENDSYDIEDEESNNKNKNENKDYNQSNSNINSTNFNDKCLIQEESNNNTKMEIENEHELTPTNNTNVIKINSQQTLNNNLNCFIIKEENQNNNVNVKFTTLVKTLRHEISKQSTPEAKGSIIVICNFKKKIDEVTSYLNQNNLPCESYYPTKTKTEKKAILANFLNNKFKIIVSSYTIIYGLTKTDIRSIVFYDLPTDLSYVPLISNKAGLDGYFSNIYFFLYDDDYFFNRSLLVCDNIDEKKCFRLLDYAFSLCSRVGKIRVKRTLGDVEKNYDPSNYTRVLVSENNNDSSIEIENDNNDNCGKVVKDKSVKVCLCFSAVQDLLGIKKNIVINFFEYFNKQNYSSDDNNNKNCKEDNDIDTNNDPTTKILSSQTKEEMEALEKLRKITQNNKRSDFIEFLGIAPSKIKMFLFISKELVFEKLEKILNLQYSQNPDNNNEEDEINAVLLNKFQIYNNNNDDSDSNSNTKALLLNYLKTIFEISKDNCFNTLEAMNKLNLHQTELLAFMFFLQTHKLLSYNALEEGVLIKINYIPNDLTYTIRNITASINNLIFENVSKLDILYITLRNYLIKKIEAIRANGFNKDTQVKYLNKASSYQEYNNNLKLDIENYFKRKDFNIAEEDNCLLPTFIVDSMKEKSNVSVSL